MLVGNGGGVEADDAQASLDVGPEPCGGALGAGREFFLLVVIRSEERQERRGRLRPADLEVVGFGLGGSPLIVEQDRGRVRHAGKKDTEFFPDTVEASAVGFQFPAGMDQIEDRPRGDAAHGAQGRRPPQIQPRRRIHRDAHSLAAVRGRDDEAAPIQTGAIIGTESPLARHLERKVRKHAVSRADHQRHPPEAAIHVLQDARIAGPRAGLGQAGKHRVQALRRHKSRRPVGRKVQRVALEKRRDPDLGGRRRRGRIAVFGAAGDVKAERHEDIAGGNDAGAERLVRIKEDVGFLAAVGGRPPGDARLFLRKVLDVQDHEARAQGNEGVEKRGLLGTGPRPAPGPRQGRIVDLDGRDGRALVLGGEGTGGPQHVRDGKFETAAGGHDADERGREGAENKGNQRSEPEACAAKGLGIGTGRLGQGFPHQARPSVLARCRSSQRRKFTPFEPRP